jgi:internalin A
MTPHGSYQTEPNMPRFTNPDNAYAEALKRIAACRQGKPGQLLDLVDLGLATLPPEIGQLTGLTTLLLSDNQLTTLPPEIGRPGSKNRIFG